MELTIAQRLTTPVVIDYQGPRRIVFTHRTLLDIGDSLGCDPLTLNLASMSARLLRAVLHAALRTAGADLSVKDAGAMLRPGAAARIRNALVEAWRASMSDPASEEQPAEEAPVEEEGRTLTTLDAWAMARFDLGLSDDAWLDMTPRMLRALADCHLEARRQRELLAGIIAAHTVNHSFRAPEEATQPHSYMPHPWPKQKPRGVTGETLIAVFGSGMPKLKGPL